MWLSAGLPRQVDDRVARDRDGVRFVLAGESAADRFGCASAAKTFARKVGLSPKRSEELAIVASELASNVIRHADSGVLELRYAAEPRPHVLMVCRDRGPGIADLDDARKDGYSRGRVLAPDALRHEGLGRGLGAVERLVDELQIESVVGVGTTIVLKKWIP
jgi:serine/threonine-protein kinase RsbT